MADNSNNKRRISAIKFLGSDRYEYYVNELVTEGKIGGNPLTAQERKEGFKKRGNKVAFQTFVDKLLDKKASATTKVRPNFRVRALPGDISRGGALAKLSAKVSQPQPEVQKQASGILDTLKSILQTLRNQLKFGKKTELDDKKEAENEAREKREGALESVKKVGKRVVDAVIAPFKSVFDRIWNFIFYSLLGRAFTKLMDWLGNPDNQKKIETIGRFLKDWWPAILGGALVFFTPLGGLIGTISSIIIGGTATLLGLTARLAAAHPVAAGTLALGTGLSVGAIALGKKLREDKEQRQRAMAGENYDTDVSGKPAQIVPYKPSTQTSIFDFIKSGLGSAAGLAKGGLVTSRTGRKIRGAGVDTQLTALQPGEIVMNRRTVQSVGANKLLALNSAYGGPNANKPKMINNIQFAANGGMIGYNVGNVNPSVNYSPLLPQINIPRPMLSMKRNKYNKSVGGSIFNIFGGGKVKETSGLDIPGATADRQLTALEPGEYVLPKDTVNALGKSLIDRLVAFTDSNSKPAKMGMRQKRYMPSPRPSRGGRGGMITLPPINQSIGGSMPMPASGTKAPSFSAIAPMNDRKINADIYGIL